MSTFGNKEALFSKVLTYYVETYGPEHMAHLTAEGHDLTTRLRNNLLSICRLASDSAFPGGCLMAKSSNELGNSCLPELARLAIETFNEQFKEEFTTFFEKEKSLGNLDVNGEPEGLADYLLTLQYGLATMARTGVDQKRLETVVNQSLLSFS